MGLPSNRDAGRCLERLPIRMLLFFLMLTSTGFMVSNLWRLHVSNVPLSSSGYTHTSPSVMTQDETSLLSRALEVLKRDFTSVITSERDELLRDITARINKGASPQDFKRVFSTSNSSTPTVQVPIQKDLGMEHWSLDWRSSFALDDKTRDYLETFETTCEAYDSENEILLRGGDVTEDGNNPPLCPCVPGTLRGRNKPDADTLLSLTWEQTASLAATVLLGGYWRPRDCVARRRVAVIVPCRDREAQLRAFLVHTHPLLQRQLVEYRIFIVEQTWPTIFNKAASMNAGFLEATKLFPFDCVLFHDVDLLAEDDRSVISCGKEALHYGAHLDKWEYKLMYSRIFGGAVSMTREQFILSNGYSNAFFGWGGEDDDFDKRVRNARIVIARPPPEVSRHTTLLHERDKANPYNPKSGRGFLNRPKTYPNEGLNTVEYEPDDVTLEPLYTWIGIRLTLPKKQKIIKQKPHQYLRVRGGCQNTEGRVLSELSLSLISCRYRCDMEPACRGLVYTPDTDDHCVLLSSVCRVDTTAGGATVYIKSVNVSGARPKQQTETPQQRAGAAAQLRAQLRPTAASPPGPNNTKTNYLISPGDCPGQDMDGLNVSLAACMDACNGHLACRGFVYGKLLSRPCWLKNATCNPTKASALGVKSYTKLSNT